jgi:hypothetical protein
MLYPTLERLYILGVKRSHRAVKLSQGHVAHLVNCNINPNLTAADNWTADWNSLLALELQVAFSDTDTVHCYPG